MSRIASSWRHTPIWEGGTKGEVKVLRDLLWTDEEIAKEMNVSVGTVQDARHKLKLRKVGVCKNTECGVRFIQPGLHRTLVFCPEHQAEYESSNFAVYNQAKFLGKNLLKLNASDPNEYWKLIGEIRREDPELYKRVAWTEQYAKPKTGKKNRSKS